MDSKTCWDPAGRSRKRENYELSMGVKQGIVQTGGTSECWVLGSVRAARILVDNDISKDFLVNAHAQTL